MPVAEKYRQQMIAKGVPAECIATVPCSVDANKFQFDDVARQSVRHLLDFAPAVLVGVYVGKFGGIYNDADNFGPTFRLIILTPDSETEVRSKLLVCPPKSCS